MAEWKVAIVRAFAEAIFPSVKEDAILARQAGKKGLAKLMEIDGASMDIVTVAVVSDMKSLTPESQKELALLFFLLRTGPGTAVIGGPSMLLPTCPFMQPFAKMSLKQREVILQYWASGPIPLLRKAFKGIKSLIVSALFNTANNKGQNPLWEGIKYNGPDPERRISPLPAREKAEAVLQRAILDLTNPPCRTPEGLLQLVKGVGKIQGSPVHENVTLEGDTVVIHTDVVIVGSGAGGGVTAALLAEAGAQVVVLEKGRFTPAAELTLRERDSSKEMYEMGTLLTTQDAGINILAGATLGGGTRVNWQASFKTPDHVRQEWATEHGLKAVTSERYTAALDAVCTRLGVTTGIEEHSKPNQKLKEGLEKLGVHCGEIPRNCSTAHTCGHCCFGCPSGDKQDMTGTYLSDAAAKGTCIFTGVFVEKVLLKKSVKDPQRKRKAVGVSALTTTTFGGRQFKLEIRAKIVVSSAGSLHTPALLLRSKITCKGNVGRNLHIHPATAVIGVFGKGFDGEKCANPGPRIARHLVTPPLPGVVPDYAGRLEVPEDIESWKGSIFSVYSKEVADWEGSGYGPLLETPAAHPGIIAASMPWLSGLDFKRLCSWMPYVSVVLVLTRDKGSGRVTIGADGLPRVHYWPSKQDRNAMMNGMILALEALAAAGSQMVGTSQGGAKEKTRHEAFRDEETLEMEDMPAFKTYLEGVRKQGIKKNAFTMFSAHQMGTARMGADPKKSCVDPHGQCWEVRNLYVADASIFPTATGVNPMITVEAMSYMVAQGLAAKCKPRQ